MANDLNTVTLVCRLTRDPELRSTPGGQSVAELRVAFNSSRKNNATGEWDDVPNYADVTVWGDQGASVARNLGKGERIGVTGRLAWREWTDAETSKKREKLSIVATSVQYLTPKDQKAAASSSPVARPATPAPPPLPADDDIPF
jgi:single-strand DNA-binding protein